MIKWNILQHTPASRRGYLYMTVVQKDTGPALLPNHPISHLWLVVQDQEDCVPIIPLLVLHPELLDLE